MEMRTPESKVMVNVPVLFLSAFAVAVIVAGTLGTWADRAQHQRYASPTALPVSRRSPLSVAAHGTRYSSPHGVNLQILRKSSITLASYNARLALNTNVAYADKKLRPPALRPSRSRVGLIW